MPIYVLEVMCDRCEGVHGTGIVLKLDEGPIEKVTVAAFYGDEPVPGDLAIGRQSFRCPSTGESFSAKENDRVLIVPAPYRV